MTGGGAGVDVVVVAYGPAHALADALAALRGRFPVLVVDNSSSSATAAVVNGAGARYVDAGANLGFAAAVNLALSHLADSGRDVLLLNPDARIDAGALSRLHEQLLAHPELAGVAPVQRVSGSDRPSRASWPWHTPAGAWAEAMGLSSPTPAIGPVLPRGCGPAPAPGRARRCGRLRRALLPLQRGRGLAETRRGRGWRVRLCPEVSAEHASGGTDSDGTRHQLRLHCAIERYVRKWYGPVGWTAYRAGTLFGLALRLVTQRGGRRAATARLARLYLTGPDRAARRAGAVPGT